jgi:hypothetical protein
VPRIPRINCTDRELTGVPTINTQEQKQASITIQSLFSTNMSSTLSNF